MERKTMYAFLNPVEGRCSIYKTENIAGNPITFDKDLSIKGISDFILSIAQESQIKNIFLVGAKDYTKEIKKNIFKNEKNITINLITQKEIKDEIFSKNYGNL